MLESTLGDSPLTHFSQNDEELVPYQFAFTNIDVMIWEVVSS